MLESGLGLAASLLSVNVQCDHDIEKSEEVLRCMKKTTASKHRIELACTCSHLPLLDLKQNKEQWVHVKLFIVNTISVQFRV